MSNISVSKLTTSLKRKAEQLSLSLLDIMKKNMTWKTPKSLKKSRKKEEK